MSIFSQFCFYSNDKKHMFISICEVSKSILIIPICTVKKRYYDKSCIIDKTEIIADNGKQVLNRKSYLCYYHSKIIASDKFLQKMMDKEFQQRCKISDELFKRIKKGISLSNDISTRMKNHFLSSL